MADASIQSELLTLSRTRDIAALIEQAHDRMSVATGSIAVHMLARSARGLTTGEKRQLAGEAWFGKMLMRLGSQLAGASETDAQGLSSILWAMAQLEQADSPLLQGLVKRLLLLAQHGRVSPSQLLLTAQALARLKLLSGPIGQALSNLALGRLGELHAAQLGTLARCLGSGQRPSHGPRKRAQQRPSALTGPRSCSRLPADGLGSGAEPLLKAILSSRLGEFSGTRSTLRSNNDMMMI